MKHKLHSHFTTTAGICQQVQCAILLHQGPQGFQRAGFLLAAELQGIAPLPQGLLSPPTDITFVLKYMNIHSFPLSRGNSWVTPPKSYPLIMLLISDLGYTLCYLGLHPLRTTQSNVSKGSAAVWKPEGWAGLSPCITAPSVPRSWW